MTTTWSFLLLFSMVYSDKPNDSDPSPRYSRCLKWYQGMFFNPWYILVPMHVKTNLWWWSTMVPLVLMHADRGGAIFQAYSCILKFIFKKNQKQANITACRQSCIWWSMNTTADLNSLLCYYGYNVSELSWSIYGRLKYIYWPSLRVVFKFWEPRTNKPVSKTP